MKEIFRLKEMLEKENIPFEFIEREELEGYQLVYPKFSNEMIEAISVIQHKYSYGNEVNLLEMLDLTTLDDVEGYLKAEDVFERIKRHYKAGGIDERS